MKIVPLFLAALAVFAICAQAHDPGLSSLDVTIGEREIIAHMSLSLADAEALGDAPAVLRVQGERGAVAPRDTSDARDEKDAHRTLVYERPAGESISVSSMVFNQLPQHHRQFVSVKDADGNVLAEQMLSAEHPDVRVEVAAATHVQPTFGSFFTLGIEHILTGYDHLLFLFSLLLASTNLRRTFWTVSAFTVAHSITLALATMDVIRVPSHIVEPVIAATIVFVAAENIVSRTCDQRRAWLTFALGLVHGLGFAGVLRDLGIGTSGAGVLAPLAAFNLGVEAGQLGIALLVVPLLAALRRHPCFAPRWMPACSAFAAALGAWWFVERLLG
ncbi:MAG TPA: HupE/UreJ family protein [Kiritimatiellia bacterium]